MPYLDAKALDTDPAGMAFLAAVLRPAAPARRPGPLAFKTAPGERTRPSATASSIACGPGRLCAPVMAEAD